jgi:hypothetical protein
LPALEGRTILTCEIVRTRNPKFISRLARSTCCQRPNRTPPERRVSVELTNFQIIETGVSSKTFQTYRDCLPLVNPKPHLGDYLFGAALPGTSITQARDSSLSRRTSRSGKHQLERRSAPAQRQRELSNYKRSYWRLLRLTLKPFEDHRPRIPRSVAGTDFMRRYISDTGRPSRPPNNAHPFAT